MFIFLYCVQDPLFCPRIKFLATPLPKIERYCGFTKFRHEMLGCGKWWTDLQTCCVCMCVCRRLQCDNIQPGSRLSGKEWDLSLAQLPAALSEQSTLRLLRHRSAQRTSPVAFHRLQRQRDTIEVRRAHHAHLLIRAVTWYTDVISLDKFFNHRSFAMLFLIGMLKLSHMTLLLLLNTPLAILLIQSKQGNYRRNILNLWK